MFDLLFHFTSKNPSRLSTEYLVSGEMVRFNVCQFISFKIDPVTAFPRFSWYVPLSPTKLEYFKTLFRTSLVAHWKRIRLCRGHRFLIPGPRGFHLLQSSSARAPQLLSVCSRAQKNQRALVLLNPVHLEPMLLNKRSNFQEARTAQPGVVPTRYK